MRGSAATTIVIAIAVISVADSTVSISTAVVKRDANATRSNLKSSFI